MKRFTLAFGVVWIVVVSCAPMPSSPDVNATVQAAVAATLAAPMAKTSVAQSRTTVTPIPTTAPTVSASKAPATSTPPRGTLIPSPTPSIVGSIVLKDGTVVEVTDIHLEKYSSWSAKMGGYNKPTRQERLQLYSETDMTTLEIPFDKIQSIKRVSKKTPTLTPTPMPWRLGVPAFTVTLVSGESLEGKILKRDEAEFLRCALNGNTTVQGYPAEFTIGFDHVVSVDFRQEQKRVLATVTTDDSKITEISEPWCQLDAEPDWHGTSTENTLEFAVGTTTLKIPFADIARIVLGAKETTLTLRSGKEIAGYPSGEYWLRGKRTVSGLPAYFYAPFTELKSVTLR